MSQSLILMKMLKLYVISFRKYYNGKQPKSQEEILHIVNRDIKIEEKHGKTMYFT